jgi:hypothetical protein
MTTALHPRLTDRLSAHIQSRTADVQFSTVDETEVDLEAGMSTAEYAVGTIAACTFAGVLLAVFRSNPIHDLIFKVLNFALTKLFK